MPNTAVGLLLLLAAAAPGFIYVGEAERRVPRQSRSDLRELAETIMVGSATTVVAILIVVGVGAGTDSFSENAWTDFASNPSAYLAASPSNATGPLLLGLLVLALSAVLAWVLAAAKYAGVPRNISPGESVIYEIVSKQPKDFDIFATIELADGRRLQGYLDAVTLQRDNPEHYEIALTGSSDIGKEEKFGLFHQARLDPNRTEVNADYALVRGSSWHIVYATYVPRRSTEGKLKARIRIVATKIRKPFTKRRDTAPFAQVPTAGSQKNNRLVHSVGPSDSKPDHEPVD